MVMIPGKSRLHGWFGICTAAMAVALTVCAQSVSAQPSYKWGVGGMTLWSQVVLRDLPPYKPGNTFPAPPPAKGIGEEEYRKLKQQVLMLPGTRLPGASMAPPASLALPGASATSFEGNATPTCGMTTASDMGLAVGQDNDSPYPVLQVNNYCISLYMKGGGLAPGFPKRLDGLFPVLPFDPRALYDWVNKRYIIVASETSSKNPKARM